MTLYLLNGRRSRPLARVLLAGLLSMPLAGCDLDSILQVDDPDFASPESLEGEEGLPVLMAGAVAEFQVAVGGASSQSEAFITVDGLITDQLRSSDTFTDRDAMDQRALQQSELGNRSDFAYNNLHRARRAANTAANAIEAIRGTSNADYTRMRMLEAYTYLYLGEGYCGNLPFTTLDDAGAIVPGAPLTTQQTFEEAITIFDQAIAAAPASSFANAARVGKARALLNLNRLAEAAATAATVPTSHQYVVEHSSNTGRQYNGNFSLQDNGRFTVPNEEGGNGLAYHEDERVDVFFHRTGFDQATPVFVPQKYSSFEDDVVVSSGVEARLIEAEAALRAGDTGAFLAHLTAATGRTYTLPGTTAEQVDLLFAERAYEMFLTGHRVGDLRRLIRQYGRTEDQVYPTGSYFQGGQYGDDIVFPVPFEEINNPLYDPSQCSTTTA